MRTAPTFGGWIEARFERGEGWDDAAYPFNLPVVRRTDAIRFHPKVTYFVGENGSGKSTLIEALAVAWGFNAEGGTLNFNFGTRQSHSPLHRHIRIARGPGRRRNGFFLRAESFYNVATEVDRLDEIRPLLKSYGGRSLHEQSHGESFFALIENRFGADGVYILDEPEAALSPNRQLSLLTRIHDLVAAGCQFIIATHSPIVLAYPDALIYRASEHGLERIDYDDAEQVHITRSFLNRRETFLKTLLADDDAETT